MQSIRAYDRVVCDAAHCVLCLRHASAAYDSARATVTRISGRPEGEVVRRTDEEVYRAYAPELVRFAQGLVGRDDAPDVVAEAFVRSMSTPGWSKVENHRAYLYRAVLNLTHDLNRRQRTGWQKELAALRPDAGADSEYRPEVLEAIRALSLRQRAALILTYWEDLPSDEVAARMGVSVGSVKQHLARGRAELRKVLDA